MMKFKSIMVIVIVFAMMSFTIIVNAQTNHNPINSETASSSEGFGWYSGSNDPSTIYSETINGAFADASFEFAKQCIARGRPGWVDITADSRFQTTFMKYAEKVSAYVVKMKKQGMSFEAIIGTDGFQKLGNDMFYQCGKTFGQIWVQREKRGWRIY